MPICPSCRRPFEPTFLKSGKPHRCCPGCRTQAKARRDKRAETEPTAVADYMRALRRQYRQAAFDAYGGQCACCGVSDYEFLTIDHTDGGGRREREETGVNGGVTFARWLAKRGFPPGYRVLCHNCNSAFGYYGHCPHSSVADEEVHVASIG